MTVSEFNEALDNPSFSLGYPIYFVTADGGVLSEEAARERRTEILDAIVEIGTNTQWEVVGCEINYEDPNLRCDHTGDLIPAAYI
jgi:hypothetical protein